MDYMELPPFAKNPVRGVFVRVSGTFRGMQGMAGNSKRYQFDPDRVAFYEAVGWQAYYDHAWLRMLWLILNLCQTQFRIPFPISVLASYYIVRASAGWVAVDHNRAKILALHEKFYALARKYSGLLLDPLKVAELEEQYWDVHRRLSGKPEKTEFINTMIELHSAIFGITPEQARESAELRVEANNVDDTITSKQSTNPAQDWQKLEALLRQCYRSIERYLEETRPITLSTAEATRP
jgi:hypothetical protein